MKIKQIAVALTTLMLSCSSSADLPAVQGLIHYSEQLGSTEVAGTGRYYRDKDGRVRQEANGQVQIFDPRAEDLMPQSSGPGVTKNTIEREHNDVETVANQASLARIRSGEVVEEALGSRRLNGLECTGIKGRTTITDASQQIDVEYEAWYSKEILVPCRTVVTTSTGYRQELSYKHVLVESLSSSLFEDSDGTPDRADN